jgi:hypothetical protein
MSPTAELPVFYDSNSLGPYAVTPRKTTGTGRYFTPDLVLHHEYAHHFMLQYFPAIYPGWYTEGFAELIGSSKMMDDGRIGYGMPALHRGNEINAYWAPLQDLLTKEKVHMLDTYAQGWAVTHFLTFDSKRSAQLRQYLTALGKGKSLAEAVTAFGDLDELNRASAPLCHRGQLRISAGQGPDRSAGDPEEPGAIAGRSGLGPRNDRVSRQRYQRNQG